MALVIDCIKCNKEIIKDPYESFTNAHRFHSDMCNNCYEETYVGV